MRHAAARAKVSATLVEMKHTPPIRGGNGKPPAEPQRLLAEALGWPMEVVILTGPDRAKGAPPCYKIDIAHWTKRVAIEVDGLGHNTFKIRAADARKTAFLEARGWTVLRFSNAQVLADLEACVQTVLSTTSKSTASTTTS
jgi:hypothetical protein